MILENLALIKQKDKLLGDFYCTRDTLFSFVNSFPLIILRNAALRKSTKKIDAGGFWKIADTQRGITSLSCITLLLDCNVRERDLWRIERTLSSRVQYRKTFRARGQGKMTVIKPYSWRRTDNRYFSTILNYTWTFFGNLIAKYRSATLRISKLQEITQFNEDPRVIEDFLSCRLSNSRWKGIYSWDRSLYFLIISIVFSDAINILIISHPWEKTVNILRSRSSEGINILI